MGVDLGLDVGVGNRRRGHHWGNVDVGGWGYRYLGNMINWGWSYHLWGVHILTSCWLDICNSWFRLGVKVWLYISIRSWLSKGIRGWLYLLRLIILVLVNWFLWINGMVRGRGRLR